MSSDLDLATHLDADVIELAGRAATRLLPPGATWSRERVLDTDVHLVEAGVTHTGPTVVLLHHWFGNVHTWRGITGPLSDTHRVLALDRPGFGFSDRRTTGKDWPHRFSREHAADLLAAVLDERSIDRVVLVGCSAGGTAALEFLDRHPDRVAGVAFISPAVTGDLGPPGWLRGLARRGVGADLAARLVRGRRGELTTARVASSWGDPTRATADDVAAYDLAFRGDGWAEALWSRMVADDAPDLRHVFPQITAPSAFIAGTLDRVIGPSWTKQAADATPGSTWTPLEGLGHTPQEEGPYLLLPAIADLLRRV